MSNVETIGVALLTFAFPFGYFGLRILMDIYAHDKKTRGKSK